MLSAACPSCGAPVRFAHAVAVATVCPACRSTVIRDDADHLALAGKVSAFPRDLSPIVLGSFGKVGGRSFLIAGVIRKGRHRARWNEWFLVFDDGKSGWLGDGNGSFQLYDAFDEVHPTAATDLRAGTTARIGGTVWQVIESDTARILAADGELPFPVEDEAPAVYADLRRGDGRTAATYDTGFDPPRLYTGRIVTLTELGLDRIRPFTGWADPDLQAAMTEPEITATRPLACPNCAAPLAVRSPDAQSLACQYCGSVIQLKDLDPTGKIDRANQTAVNWKPTLALGARGRLDGKDWEIIGVMDRFVRFEGERFTWTEYFLFNPYHGYRWLTEDHGTRQWSLVERLPDLPVRPTARRALHAGHTYRAFTKGAATVDRVIGEFTWEVHAGDVADTVDFVDPPWMLSVESERNELTASLGKWLAADEVSGAFPESALHRPSGIAPHQPNTYDAAGTIALFTGATLAFTFAAVALFIGTLLWSANERLTDWTTTLSGDGDRIVSVSPPFVVPASRPTVDVTLTTTLRPDVSLVHVSLLNRDDGRVFHASTDRTGGSASLGRVTPGTYVVIAEADGAGAGTLDGRTVTVSVIHDPPVFFPVLLAFAVVMLGPGWWFFGRMRFENTRWQNSDFSAVE